MAWEEDGGPGGLHVGLSANFRRPQALNQGVVMKEYLWPLAVLALLAVFPLAAQ
jgi:hypothetical protein